MATITEKYEEFLSKELNQTKLPPLRLLVSGETGTGKTTIAHDLAIALGATFVDLRLYSSVKSLDHMITDAQSEKKFLKHSTSLKPKILILDALDKMVPGATYQEIIKNLREIRSCATDFHVVVITTRTHFFRTIDDEHFRDTYRFQLLHLKKDSVLQFAEHLGHRNALEAAMERSTSIEEMACKPLLLGMLIQCLKDDYDIKKIEDYEDLFSYIIEPWLIRDTEDSILSQPLRLKCMQGLALYALSTGGKPISYSRIDSLINIFINPLNYEQRERFNTDLRVCGFLRRMGSDLFEFQHASFYEY